MTSDTGVIGLERPPHALPAADVVQRLQSQWHEGLSEIEAEKRLARYGYNELAAPPTVPLWRKFFEQFQELVIWILIAAAIISGAVGEWADTAAILAIVLANGIIGFLQEEKAERSLAALKQLAAPMAKVTRGGQLRQIPARLLTVGDRIELEAGDNIPADARLLESFSLQSQEAALTGESQPVEKNASLVLQPDAPLAERRNMLYMGTMVAAGKATAIVTAIGMQTELGAIASLLGQEPSEPTPLQRRLSQLGKLLVVVCLVIVAVIFVLELLRGGELLNVALLSISLAVAAVPEGLPAVVTLALAIGLQRMVRRNALIRKLPSVETLGSVTVICSDKTGTLTRNEMTVRVVAVGDVTYQVTGTGYSPQGRFLRAPSAGAEVDRAAAAGTGELLDADNLPADLRQALVIGTWCNNARLTPSADGRSWTVIGDPTEAALLVLGLKGGISLDGQGRRIAEIPFDSERKAMSMVIEDPQGKRCLYAKGAPEVLLQKCDRELRGGGVVPLDASRRSELARRSAAFAEQALRVLALAYRSDPQAIDGIFQEEGLIFAGLAGMIDPPREEAKRAVARCREAGVRPIMITGDHPETARAIARELEIARPGDQVVTGGQLDRMSAATLVDEVARIAVYARVSAEHKLRVVRAWKARREVVAMTGDGVNDAPAIKAADIGIAMGLTGTDVTKEAADMVLLDDNFASIVNAVEEGRGIYDNIQKFVHYLLACNTAEVLFMFFAAVLGWPPPLAAIQILWINLVTDGLPALALGMEPPEPDIMRRKPRPPRQPVITLSLGLRMLLEGLLMSGVTLLGFYWVYFEANRGVEQARTVAFCILSYSQLFFSFACRSQRYTLPELGYASNPYLFAAIAVSGLLQFGVIALPFLRPVFETTAHPAEQWAMVFALALVPVTLVEVLKLIRGAIRGRRQRRLDVHRGDGESRP
jgi:Ca2+-transporting ATPase